MTSSDSSLSDDVEQFLRLLRKCRLLSPGAVDTLAAKLTDDESKKLDVLIESLVAKNLLTHFQATKLKQGTFQGLVLGPYHVLSPLGKGGMGAVFLAKDTRKNDLKKSGQTDPALVALKVLPPKKAKRDGRNLARFQREQEMAERVSHPHLTKTYESGDIDGIHYIAMEYIRGQSLRQYVTAYGPLLVSRAARVFCEVADGLIYAHKQELIHRDLKPSNIMLTPNGHAKILDLGLAIRLDEELPLDKMIVGGQGYVVGTMDYIAPEQVNDPTAVDGRADLYSLGCTMYFALTGRTPFPGGTSKEKMNRHKKEFADPITDYNPTIPVDFVRIIDKLMEKSPGRRYPNAQAVKDALAPWVAGDPETPYDVDVEQTEAEVIQELERTQGTAREVLESIPLMAFGNRAEKYSGRKKVATATPTPEPVELPEPAVPTGIEESETGPGRSLWLIPALIFGGFLGVIVLIAIVVLLMK
jgi:eukaryotic-like serine/threonine-protein kinase